MLRDLAKNHVLGNSIRLGIMLYLLPRRRVLFKELQDALKLTPGNLDSHLKFLKRHGYVKIKKVIADRPRTMVWITDIGAVETKRYIKILKESISMEGERMLQI